MIETSRLSSIGFPQISIIDCSYRSHKSRDLNSSSTQIAAAFLQSFDKVLFKLCAGSASTRTQSCLPVAVLPKTTHSTFHLGVPDPCPRPQLWCALPIPLGAGLCRFPPGPGITGRESYDVPDVPWDASPAEVRRDGTGLSPTYSFIVSISISLHSSTTILYTPHSPFPLPSISPCHLECASASLMPRSLPLNSQSVPLHFPQNTWSFHQNLIGTPPSAPPIFPLTIPISSLPSRYFNPVLSCLTLS